MDVLFDVFEFVLSPAGLAAIFGLIALGFIWDFATASDNRTLLGQKRQVATCTHTNIHTHPSVHIYTQLYTCTYAHTSMHAPVFMQH